MPTKVEVYTLEQRLSYMTDNKVRKTVENLLSEIKEWDKDNILIEPTKYDISIKVSGRLFAYICPRRKHFMIYTYDTDGEWKGFPVKSDEDLKDVTILARSNYDKYK